MVRSRSNTHVSWGSKASWRSGVTGRTGRGARRTDLRETNNFNNLHCQRAANVRFDAIGVSGALSKAEAKGHRQQRWRMRVQSDLLCRRLILRHGQDARDQGRGGDRDRTGEVIAKALERLERGSKGKPSNRREPI